jgi:hypothetical protein
MPRAQHTPPADPIRVERYERRVALRPLFGVERLVRIQRRKWNGVLFCDNIVTVSDTVTFAKSNTRLCLFPLWYKTLAPGFLGEPRMSDVNRAPAEIIRQFQDDGAEFHFYGVSEGGRTYSVECDVYRPFETHTGAARLNIHPETSIATYIHRLDLSAYARAGYPVDTPVCEYEPEPKGGRGKAARPSAPRRLVAKTRGPAVWEWHCHDLVGGTVRWAWLIENYGSKRAAEFPNIDKLALELSVDARFAKDLHNFVSICYYFVADFRSVNAIGQKMAADRTVLLRSLDAIEKIVGAEVIQRTKGKGLVRITPAGEAVLEWWSRFYMRWIPISLDPVAGK